VWFTVGVTGNELKIDSHTSDWGGSEVCIINAGGSEEKRERQLLS